MTGLKCHLSRYLGIWDVFFFISLSGKTGNRNYGISFYPTDTAVCEVLIFGVGNFERTILFVKRFCYSPFKVYWILAILAIHVRCWKNPSETDGMSQPGALEMNPCGKCDDLAVRLEAHRLFTDTWKVPSSEINSYKVGAAVSSLVSCLKRA
jgi:hypothetical protein